MDLCGSDLTAEVTTKQSLQEMLWLPEPLVVTGLSWAHPGREIGCTWWQRFLYGYLERQIAQNRLQISPHGIMTEFRWQGLEYVTPCTQAQFSQDSEPWAPFSQLWPRAAYP